MQPPQPLNRLLQPDPRHMRHPREDFVIDQRSLAFGVGLVAFGIPAVMLYAAFVGWPLARTCFYGSISHFYYAQFFGGALVALLAFIGTFLLAYRGEALLETVLARLAGIAALGVALFPTEHDGCPDTGFSGRIFANLERSDPAALPNIVLADPPRPELFFQLFPAVSTWHFTAAGIMFGFLAFYSFFVFTRVIPEIHLTADGRLTPVKRQRNAIYNATGAVITLCILALIAGKLGTQGGSWPWWEHYRLTFVFEALALIAFGVAWMVKGRFLGLAFRDPDPRLAV